MNSFDILMVLTPAILSILIALWVSRSNRPKAVSKLKKLCIACVASFSATTVIGIYVLIILSLGSYIVNDFWSVLVMSLLSVLLTSAFVLERKA